MSSSFVFSAMVESHEIMRSSLYMHEVEGVVIILLVTE